MPRLNVQRLVEILTGHQMRLYEIYLLSNNNQLSDAILIEIDKLIAIIKVLEEFLEDAR
jgi:hypothetical protein